MRLMSSSANPVWFGPFPDLLRHFEERDDRVIFSGKVQLEQQGTHGHKTGIGKHVNTSMCLFPDVDVALREVIQDSEYLRADRLVIGSLASRIQKRHTEAMLTQAGRSIRGSSLAPDRYMLSWET